MRECREMWQQLFRISESLPGKLLRLHQCWTCTHALHLDPVQNCDSVKESCVHHVKISERSKCTAVGYTGNKGYQCLWTTSWVKRFIFKTCWGEWAVIVTSEGMAATSGFCVCFEYAEFFIWREEQCCGVFPAFTAEDAVSFSIWKKKKSRKAHLCKLPNDIY